MARWTRWLGPALFLLAANSHADDVKRPMPALYRGTAWERAYARGALLECPAIPGEPGEFKLTARARRLKTSELRAAVHDDDPVVRTRALSLLGDTKERRAASLAEMIQGLADEAEGPRAAARGLLKGVRVDRHLIVPCAFELWTDALNSIEHSARVALSFMLTTRTPPAPAYMPRKSFIRVGREVWRVPVLIDRDDVARSETLPDWLRAAPFGRPDDGEELDVAELADALRDPIAYRRAIASGVVAAEWPASAPACAAVLKDGPVRSRRLVLEAFSQVDPDDAWPELVRLALADADGWVVARGARLVRRLGKDDRESMVEPLAAQLAVRVEVGRAALMGALGALAPKRLASQLVLDLRAADPRRRRSALRHLAALAPASREDLDGLVRDLLADEEPAIRLSAVSRVSGANVFRAQAPVRALWEFLGEPALDAAAEDRDPAFLRAKDAIRQYATARGMSPSALDVFLELSHTMDQKREVVPPPVLARVLQMLESQSSANRVVAISTVGLWGEAGREAVPALLELWSAAGSLERGRLCWALERAAPNDFDARRAWSQALHDQSAYTRMRGARALHAAGKFGARVFQDALRDPNPRVVTLALAGLTYHTELAADAALTLNRITRDGTPLQRRRAIWLLGEMGKSVPSVARRLREIRATGARLDRARATIALAKLEPDKIYLKALYEIGGQKSFEFQRGAIRALGRMGSVAEPAVETLTGWYFKVRGQEECAMILAALIDIGPKGCESASELLRWSDPVEARDEMIAELTRRADAPPDDGLARATLALLR